MAHSRNNIITHGASGKLGDLIVFRQKNDKTFITKAPKKRTVPPTEGEIESNNRFQQAVIYGQAIIADPELKEEYAVEGRKAYNVAMLIL